MNKNGYTFQITNKHYTHDTGSLVCLDRATSVDVFVAKVNYKSYGPSCKTDVTFTLDQVQSSYAVTGLPFNQKVSDITVDMPTITVTDK